MKDGAVVGAGGGTVTAAAGVVVLQIPAGAVSQPTQFTVFAQPVQVIAKGWSDSRGRFGPPPTDGGTQRCAIRYLNVP